MFDFLKKKIGGFIEKFTRKEEEAAAETAALEKTGEPAPGEKIKLVEPKIAQAPPVPPEVKPVEPAPIEKPRPAPVTEPKPEPELIPRNETEHGPRPEPKPAQKQEPRVAPISPKPKPIEKSGHVSVPKPEPAMKRAAAEPAQSRPKEPLRPQKPVETPVEVERQVSPRLPKMERKEPPEPKPPAEPGTKTPQLKVGIFDTLKGMVTGQITIAEKDVLPMLEELELELLESDVAFEVSESIRQSLQARLIGAKISRGQLNGFVKESIEQTLLGLLENNDQFGLVERMERGSAPFKIMFLGPNGAGKTTTMAKVAHLLMKQGKKVVLAAGDTFRAAAIEQLGVHAERLGVPIIKRPYGSDATAVAFDAVGYAKAHNVDAVLIDTAGRQDTNINLLNELKKMQRVIRPDLKIYIGESIAGNALLEQVGAFHRELGVDGVILTKMDCDPKGGTMLSVSKATGRPILYLGTGQGYEDLERFDAREIVRRILS